MRTYAARVPDLGAIVASSSAPGSQKVGQQIGNAVAGATSSTTALPKLGNVANLTTGALARVAAGFVMNPVTVLKVRYESSYYAYTSMLSAARDIAAKEGIRGFFAGFGATAVRDAPYAGLYVLIYEQAKTRFGALKNGHARELDGSSKLTINFVSGVVAAVSATTLTNPFDAIKTRIQLMPAKYGNMLSAARMMVKEEGPRSFFDGLSLRIGRKALSSALAWTVYEELIRRAEQRLV